MKFLSILLIAVLALSCLPAAKVGAEDLLNLVGKVYLENGSNNVALYGNIAFVTAGRNLYAVDASDVTAPFIKSVFGPATSCFVSLEIYNGYIYAFTEDKIYILTYGTDFVLKAEKGINYCEMRNTYISDETLYIGHRYCNVDIYSLEQPLNPVFVKEIYFGYGYGDTWSVYQSDKQIYVGAGKTLRVLDFNFDEVRNLALFGTVRAIFSFSKEKGIITVISEGQTYKIREKDLKIVSSFPNWIEVFRSDIGVKQAYLAGLYALIIMNSGRSCGINSYYLYDDEIFWSIMDVKSSGDYLFIADVRGLSIVNKP